MMEIKSALVTGASGFIGVPLCQELVRRGVRVKALGRVQKPGPWSAFYTCDLASEQLHEEQFEGVDAIFHLASRTHEVDDDDRAFDQYFDLNVEGTRKLLHAAKRKKVRLFVFFSSVKATGEGGEDLIDEDVLQQPVSAYGRSKLEAENLVLETAAGSEMFATILRLPLVYGNGVKGNLEDMIDAVALGRFPPIEECGNRRAMVHVNDVVNAALLAAGSENAKGKKYYVTDDREYSTRQMYDTIRRGLGKPPATWSVPVSLFRIAALLGDATRKAGIRMPIDSSRLQKLIGSARYDSSRIRRELGFSPKETFDSAIDDMIGARRNPPAERRDGAYR